MRLIADAYFDVVHRVFEIPGIGIADMVIS
jgi:hypothetical protein